VFFTLNIGVFFGDLLWYELGSRIRHHGWFIRWVEKIARPFDDHLRTRTFRTIFFSKFAYGVHHAILVRAGSLKLKLTKFIEDDFVSSLVWITIVGGIGYFSSASFESLSHIRNSLNFIEASFLIALVAFFLIWNWIASKTKSQL
jgi:membrane protein DedA with SNARE-associated domain